MFKKARIFFRIISINFVLARYGLDKIVLALPRFAPIRFLAHCNPWCWFANKNLTDGERIRLALESLGPIFVKFGQSLSTRSDLIPSDIIQELKKLQDNVPAFSGAEAKKMVEEVYQQPIETVFAEFTTQPKASASIAQVHEVRLKGSQQRAIIKIIRPHIEKVIKRDLELLYALAKLAEKYWSEGKRLRPVEVIQEFDRVIHDELDLVREAANASQLRRNFAGAAELYIPEIHWDYVRDKVMVMEYIEGIPIGDITTLKQQGFNLQRLAELGVEIFFTQVFRDSFFHGDMHPGNIFVDPYSKSSPRYIAVDFGIVGTLNADDKYYLASNLLAFFQRDYRKVAELHVESNWVGVGTRVDEFESAVRAVCEPVFEKPLSKISFGRTLMRLFQIGRRFDMQVQPQLVLLQKTLLQIEGLGRSIYPELDLWQTAKPFLEDWIKNQLGPKAFMNQVVEQSRLWSVQWPKLPALVYDALKKVNSPQCQQLSMNTQLPSSRRTKSSAVRPLLRGIFLGGGMTLALISGFAWYATSVPVIANELVLPVNFTAMTLLAVAALL